MARSSSNSCEVSVSRNACWSSSPSDESPRMLVAAAWAPANPSNASIPAPRSLEPIRRTHPSVRVLCHTSQESRLVSEIPHPRLLQPAHSLARDSRLPPPSSPRLLPHLGAHARHGHLRDVRDDDEGSGEGALVSCFRALDRLGSEDDVQTAASERVSEGKEGVGGKEGRVLTFEAWIQWGSRPSSPVSGPSASPRTWTARC